MHDTQTMTTTMKTTVTKMKRDANPVAPWDWRKIKKERKGSPSDKAALAK